MAVFVQRAVNNMGGLVSNKAELQSFAGGVETFQGMAKILELHPSWATWDKFPACVADRDSSRTDVGVKLGEVCPKLWGFNCKDIPANCKGNTWKEADYVFSVYYNQIKGNPLFNCHLGGAAKYASEADYRKEDSECVVTKSAKTTPLTDEGYQAIINQRDSRVTETFIYRVVKDKLKAKVQREDWLESFARKPPSSMFDVLRLLKDAKWLCGGVTGRECDGPGWSPGGMPEDSDPLWWRNYAFLALAALVCVALACSAIYVNLPTKDKARQHSATRLCEVTESSSSDSE
eukprot:TRINITY_DN42913_c0_g1_i1.p1 TRINITY_DN42913_c0_g1~~TRINITY_DN42913_c0_g1_i1.p1  ORF type:complete len:337 (-),score=62.94 TRINITY_DN42913_c0_g1_i1:49-918(-)